MFDDIVEREWTAHEHRSRGDPAVAAVFGVECPGEAPAEDPEDSTAVSLVPFSRVVMGRTVSMRTRPRPAPVASLPQAPSVRTLAKRRG